MAVVAFITTNGLQVILFLYNLLYLVFLILVNLAGVMYYLIMVLVCISLKISDVELLFVNIPCGYLYLGPFTHLLNQLI